jgi:hypothetical protein
MNDTRSGTSRHARCHSSSALSLFLSGLRARGFPALPSGPASSLDGKEGSTDACRRLRFATPQAPVQHSSRWLSAKTTTHPAPIPQEVAGSSRLYPTIPATRVSKDPAHGGNPRTSPPRPEAVRPACHAGGRGFESRRSRRKHPANQAVLLLAQAQPTAASFDPALIPQVMKKGLLAGISAPATTTPDDIPRACVLGSDSSWDFAISRAE